mmetsp:Transcript_56561/g.183887  ORF Transcript_56561/g.183887 Transcript_56561/m.183887 type:complete len:232 (+) Transcript_56561:2557-3252(+)
MQHDGRTRPRRRLPHGRRTGDRPSCREMQREQAYHREVRLQLDHGHAPHARRVLAQRDDRLGRKVREREHELLVGKFRIERRHRALRGEGQERHHNLGATSQQQGDAVRAADAMAREIRSALQEELAQPLVGQWLPLVHGNEELAHLALQQVGNQLYLRSADVFSGEGLGRLDLNCVVFLGVEGDVADIPHQHPLDQGTTLANVTAAGRGSLCTGEVTTDEEEEHDCDAEA